MSGDILKESDKKELIRFYELGHLFASLIHEISNPLTSALLQIDQLNDPSSNVRQIKKSLYKLKNYLEAARKQLKKQSNNLSFCLKPQIQEVIRLIHPLAKQANIELKVSSLPHYKIYGDRIKFQQILVNLLINAVEAYANKPDLLFKQIFLNVNTKKKFILIEIVDFAEVIDANKLNNIFKPLYSTKTLKGSSGLGYGLYFVKQTIKRTFNGQISVASNKLRGTRFYLKLPAQEFEKSHFK